MIVFLYYFVDLFFLMGHGTEGGIITYPGVNLIYFPHSVIKDLCQLTEGFLSLVDLFILMTLDCDHSISGYS